MRKCEACRRDSGGERYCRTCERLVHTCVVCHKRELATLYQGHRYCQSCWDDCLYVDRTPMEGHKTKIRHEEQGFDDIVRLYEEDRD